MPLATTAQRARLECTGQCHFAHSNILCCNECCQTTQTVSAKLYAAVLEGGRKRTVKQGHEWHLRDMTVDEVSHYARVSCAERGQRICPGSLKGCASVAGARQTWFCVFPSPTLRSQGSRYADMGSVMAVGGYRAATWPARRLCTTG